MGQESYLGFGEIQLEFFGGGWLLVKLLMERGPSRSARDGWWQL
jgi:hypothetical protein